MDIDDIEQYVLYIANGLIGQVSWYLRQDPTLAHFLYGGSAIKVAGKNSDLIQHEETPVMIAAARGRNDVLGVLFEHGAGTGIDEVYAFGCDALMIASYSRQELVSTVEILLDHGASHDGRDHGGQSALHMALTKGYIATGRLLVRKGADLRARDSTGKEALEMCGRLTNHFMLPSSLQELEVELEALFADGPHISQVRRRAWLRRKALINFLAAFDTTSGIAFRPLAARQALMLLANPPLPPDVEIPPVPMDTPAQRIAHYHNQIFGIEAESEGIVRLIVSFL